MASMRKAVMIASISGIGIEDIGKLKVKGARGRNPGRRLARAWKQARQELYWSDPSDR